MDMMTDLYPSRTEPKPRIAERLDPVIHPEPGEVDGPLTKDQLEAFERDGFLAIDRFFDEEEVHKLQAELRRLWRDNRDSRAPEIVREPDGEDIRSIFAVHRDNAAIREALHAPKLVRAVQQLLGKGLYIHQSRINYKPGFRGKEFYWHSDFETWHIEDGMPRMHALSVSIALTRNTPNNGPLMLIPGSHKYYVSCIGETPERHYEKSLRKQEYGVPDDDTLAWLAEERGIVAPTGEPGSIVIFDCNTMHGSNSNITPEPRSNVFAVYNSVSNKLVEPFSGQPPRPWYIGERDPERID